MIDDLHEAFIQRCKGDPYIEQTVGKFADIPGVFGFKPAPPTTPVDAPFIVIEYPINSLRQLDKTANFIEVLIVVEIFKSNNKDNRSLNELAEYVAGALQDDAITLPAPIELVYNIADAPVGIDNQEELGRSVQFRVGLRR